MKRTAFYLLFAMLATVASTAIAGANRPSLFDRSGIELYGFIDTRAGIRTLSAPFEKETSLAETRLQLDIERMGDLSTLRLRADLLYDPVLEENDLDLEAGTGAIDLREANFQASPLSFMDVKMGRQILTWGTGDLLFINDMFPKDWQAFFTGRDVEYLKAPSDALFVSLFPSFANIDISYTPRFDSDRYINGSRLSYWNGLTASSAGRSAVVEPKIPGEWFSDDEIALRVSRNVAGCELALYLYNGFWKTPNGIIPSTMTPYFPALSVYGASVRAGLGKGLVSIEGGYYDSRDDSTGTDPFVPNGEIRGLLGYERELRQNLSLGVQYYVEHMMNHDDYLRALPAGMIPADEDRHVITTRLTKQALNQNLVLSLFVYYSPTDNDAYLRPSVKYKATDQWLVTTGANLFTGNYDHTFFGQFERNSNIYAGVRRSF